MSGLTIYAFSVQKGILALCQMPGREGNYQADLDHIADWKPSIVMSMTTPGEMADNGAENFGADISDIGARWVHLPVMDMQVPTHAPDNDIDWESPQKAAIGTLKGGGRVLIHCVGGCGRSGMMALRLMIRAGEDPDQALKRLRTIRPCAIETDAQLNWARAILEDADPEG